MFPSIPPGGTKSRVETQVRVTVDLAHASSSSCEPLKYDRVGSWKWLRTEDDGDNDDDATGEYEAFTGYVSPVSEEDDEWIPSTPGPIFDHHEDERTVEAIKQEDKLGILSLSQ